MFTNHRAPRTPDASLPSLPREPLRMIRCVEHRLRAYLTPEKIPAGEGKPAAAHRGSQFCCCYLSLHYIPPILVSTLGLERTKQGDLATVARCLTLLRDWHQYKVHVKNSSGIWLPPYKDSPPLLHTHENRRSRLNDRFHRTRALLNTEICNLPYVICGTALFVKINPGFLTARFVPLSKGGNSASHTTSASIRKGLLKGGTYTYS